MDEGTVADQMRRDAAYLRACREHGIEPMPAAYRIETARTGDNGLDFAAQLVARGDTGTVNGTACVGAPRTAEENDADAESKLALVREVFLKLLDLLCPPGPLARAVTTAGRRALILQWLLGRRTETLAELGRRLEITRACMSAHARFVEAALGIHGRLQKRAGTRQTYADNAHRSWKLRRLDKAMREAAGGETPEKAA